ncbi:MAG: serine acetyltransferase, partial [Rhodobacteraceae bacterium]|nr:serine acetyltransferase [Paracoccaceae bacterium]
MEQASMPVSAEVPDWSRERLRHLPWRGRMLLRAVRGFQAKGPLPLLRKLLWTGLHRWASLISQCDIPLNLQLGGGLLLPHPQGIVINHQAVIGPNALIFHQVTIGSNGRG